MNSLRSAVVLLLVLTSPAIAADAPLVWKFQSGDQHHYRLTQNMQTEMALGQANQKVSSGIEQVIDMTWKVEQVDDQGDAKVSQSVNRVRMEVEAPGQPQMKYDTTSKEAPTGFAATLAPLFKAMTEEPFKMSISRRGQLSDLELPETFAKALKNAPGAATMGEMFSDDGFLKMMQKSSLVLPEPKDLTPGLEWSTSSSMENPQLGSITTKVTYRYLGLREVKGTELAAFAVEMGMEFGEGPGGVSVDIENQDSHGEIFFHPEHGRLESSKLQQELDMQLVVGPQTLKQKIKQNVTFERVEESADQPEK